MKKYLLGFFAIALAVAFSAFTVSSSKTTDFYYFATTADGSAFANPDQWVTPSTSHLCTGSFGNYCSVQIPDNKIELGSGENAGKIRPKHPIEDEFDGHLRTELLYEEKQVED